MQNINDNAQYFELDDHEIIKTTQILQARVEERFPGSGLAKVAGKVASIAQGSQQRIHKLVQPYWPLRILTFVLMGLTLALLGYVISGMITWDAPDSPIGFVDFIAVLEPALGATVFMTAYFVFVSTFENRWKQQAALRAINELRSLAHIIDMHQLTKDPERMLVSGPDTMSSPKRTMSLFEMGRYLDYCSELLSLVSKIGSLYAQAYPKSVVLTAVDEVEMLATGLSRKIWQKIVLLKESRTAENSAPE